MSDHALGSFCTNTTGGLSRLWCDGCAEETPHKNGVCTRSGCGARHAAYPVRAIFSRSINVTPRKGGVPKVFPLLLKGSNPPTVKLEVNQHGPSWEQAHRDANVVARYAAGEATSAIAAVHKLTGARVRQILQNAGVWKK